MLAKVDVPTIGILDRIQAIQSKSTPILYEFITCLFDSVILSDCTNNPNGAKQLIGTNQHYVMTDRLLYVQLPHMFTKYKIMLNPLYTAVRLSLYNNHMLCTNMFDNGLLYDRLEDNNLNDDMVYEYNRLYRIYNRVIPSDTLCVDYDVNMIGTMIKAQREILLDHSVYNKVDKKLNIDKIEFNDVIYKHEKQDKEIHSIPNNMLRMLRNIRGNADKIIEMCELSNGWYVFNGIPIVCRHEVMIYQNKSNDDILKECGNNGECRFCGEHILSTAITDSISTDYYAITKLLMLLIPTSNTDFLFIYTNYMTSFILHSRPDLSYDQQMVMGYIYTYIAYDIINDIKPCMYPRSTMDKNVLEYLNALNISMDKFIMTVDNYKHKEDLIKELKDLSQYVYNKDLSSWLSPVKNDTNFTDIIIKFTSDKHHDKSQVQQLFDIRVTDIVNNKFYTELLSTVCPVHYTHVAKSDKERVCKHCGFNSHNHEEVLMKYGILFSTLSINGRLADMNDENNILDKINEIPVSKKFDKVMLCKDEDIVQYIKSISGITVDNPKEIFNKFANYYISILTLTEEDIHQAIEYMLLKYVDIDMLCFNQFEVRDL